MRVTTTTRRHDGHDGNRTSGGLSRTMANSVESIPVAPSVTRPIRWPRAIVVPLRFCRRKPLGAIGAVIVIGLIVMAAFAEQIAPYPTMTRFAGRG